MRTAQKFELSSFLFAFLVDLFFKSKESGSFANFIFCFYRCMQISRVWLSGMTCMSTCTRLSGRIGEMFSAHSIKQRLPLYRYSSAPRSKASWIFFSR